MLTGPMRHLLPVSVCAALALSGCGEVTTKDEPDTPSSAVESASTSAPEAKKKVAKRKPAPKKASIGDSITLDGFEGAKVKVKLLRVLDPVAGGEYEEPAAGKRYIGIEIQMTNVGTKTYKDSPSNGATIVYGDDRQADAAFMVGGPCALGDFGSETRISPGSKRRGCLPFELPKSRKAKMFQFALDSGFADEGGEWRLR